MENGHERYKSIFTKPNADDMKLKNNLICLEDFEYYTNNKTYNPMFIRTLANSIYAINHIYEDFKNNPEKINVIFNEMPFGFGEVKNDDNTKTSVLYTTSNEEHFYKSLNDEEFLNDLQIELDGKIQEDFSFKKEGNNLNKTYAGLIYEENAIFNIKNIIKKDFDELPNLIFYINKEKLETINKISKLFHIELIEDNDAVANATIQIEPKIQYWPGIHNNNELVNINLENRRFFGFNELDFAFLNKKYKKIESNRIYYNILKKGEDIDLKKDYAYYIEVKLTFPSEPENEIKKLFKKAKKFFSLYKKKYNLVDLGIILVYDSVESNGNSFCNNFNINFSYDKIDLHIIYLHIGVQVSNMNYLVNKVFKLGDELTETKKALSETKTELAKTNIRLNNLENNYSNFQNSFFSNLINILPDNKDAILSMKEKMKISQNPNKELSLKTVKLYKATTMDNKKIKVPTEDEKTIAKKEEDVTPINIKTNVIINTKNNIENIKSPESGLNSSNFLMGSIS